MIRPFMRRGIGSKLDDLYNCLLLHEHGDNGSNIGKDGRNSFRLFRKGALKRIYLQFQFLKIEFKQFLSSCKASKSVKVKSIGSKTNGNQVCDSSFNIHKPHFFNAKELLFEEAAGHDVRNTKGWLF